MNELYGIVKDRKKNPVDGSYTNRLLENGYERIAQKVGEEAVGLVGFEMGVQVYVAVFRVCEAVQPGAVGRVGGVRPLY